MKIKPYLIRAAQLLLLMVLANPVSAGQVDRSSSDTTEIELSIPEMIRIDNLTDINMGDYNGVDRVMIGSTSFCVFKNGRKHYRLKAVTDHG